MRALLLVLLLSGWAQEKSRAPDLTIVLGRSAVVVEERDVKRMAIGDSDVIGDVLINPKEILLNAKKAGTTNFIVWYADGTPRRERTIHVEHDLAFLRGHLAKVDPSLTAVTAPDGSSIILRGDVETGEMRDQLGADVNRMYGAKPSLDPAKPGEGPRVPIVNQVASRTRPAGLETFLLAAVRPYGEELKIRRMQRGASPDDAKDTFLLEGAVPTQTAYAQALIVLDKMLGGPGTEFVVVANEGGGLHGVAPSQAPATPTPPPQNPTTPGSTIATPTAAPMTLTPANLASNFGRAVAIKSKADRWISFVRVRSLPQVMVGVRILVLDRSKTRDIGVSWDQLIRWTASASYSRVNGNDSNSLTLTRDAFTLTQAIRVLETRGYVRTLSEPNLVTMSGEIATFLVGGDVPITEVVSTSVSSLQGTQFREFGIRLTVRPVVSEDGRTVTIDAMPDISEVAGTALPNTTPGFRRTSLRTTAQLMDGEGLILGGLITTADEKSHESVPGLGAIPVLGVLFSREIDRTAEKELAIVLMPRIVHPKPASAFALEVPPVDFRIRGGVFLDPELGTLPTIPDFYFKNIGEGERVAPGQPK